MPNKCPFHLRFKKNPTFGTLNFPSPHKSLLAFCVFLQLCNKHVNFDFLLAPEGAYLFIFLWTSSQSSELCNNWVLHFLFHFEVHKVLPYLFCFKFCNTWVNFAITRFFNLCFALSFATHGILFFICSFATIECCVFFFEQ